MKKKIHATGVIFENEKGEILVLKRHHKSLEGEKWGLVGGSIESNEEPKSAAVREVHEEIGHKIDSSRLQYLKEYHWERDEVEIIFETFKIKVRSEQVNLNLNINENTEHLWALPNDLSQRQDLVTGLYPILDDEYHAKSS
ncbi:NUDIX hydrolase [Candidatus Saccharibacteria bacterium]|nr:NUDIX hydrolase [Candidatus Saccharibacteria bacterium]